MPRTHSEVEIGVSVTPVSEVEIGVSVIPASEIVVVDIGSRKTSQRSTCEIFVGG